MLESRRILILNKAYNFNDLRDVLDDLPYNLNAHNELDEAILHFMGTLLGDEEATLFMDIAICPRDGQRLEDL